MRLTHKGMLKAISILKKEKSYFHENFQNLEGNCFCALGAIAFAHGAFEIDDGVINSFGWEAHNTIREHRKVTPAIERLCGILADSTARVTRKQAINSLRLIDRTFFKSN